MRSEKGSMVSLRWRLTGSGDVVNGVSHYHHSAAVCRLKRNGEMDYVTELTVDTASIGR